MTGWRPSGRCRSRRSPTALPPAPRSIATSLDGVGSSHPNRAWSRPPQASQHQRRLGIVPVYADPTDGLAVPVHLLRTWTAGLLGTIGTPPDIAADVAEVLIASDRRGIASHCTARLPHQGALGHGRGLGPPPRPLPDAGRG